MIGFMFGGNNLTTARLKQTGKINLALPGERIAEKVMASGRSYVFDTDKVKELGIDMKKVEGSDIAVPAESRLVYECSLVEARPIGIICSTIAPSIASSGMIR